jgi:hypothetical protein
MIMMPTLNALFAKVPRFQKNKALAKKNGAD